MNFLYGLIIGIVVASAASLSAQDDYLKGYGGGVQVPEQGGFWTPGGTSGTYSHNPALGSTWIQDSEGNAGYLYTTPGRRNPC